MVGNPPAAAFSDEWKRHARRIEPLVTHLRFDLAQQGRTRDAIALIERVVRHRRLSRLVFANPISIRLPYVLVAYRSEVTDDELREVIAAIQPFMDGYGWYHVELALKLLGDPEAAERGAALLQRYAPQR